MTVEANESSPELGKGLEYWWLAPEEDAWRYVINYVRALEETQRAIHERNLRHARLYSNSDILGLDWTLAVRDYSHKPLGRVTENLVQSVIDTAASMIAKNRPRATFLTNGGDFSQQRRAALLEKFVEGIFHKTDLYEKTCDIFRDACIYGTGFLKVFLNDDRELTIDRIYPDEIIVDELECRTSGPRAMHHRQFIDREVLKNIFPDYAEAIDSATQDDIRRPWTSYRRIEPQQVAVVESWHLPSGKGAKDGRHCICIDKQTIVWEPYTKDYFPFVVYRWSKPVIGFYGQGLAEQLTGYQLRVNKLRRTIEQAQDLIAVPRVFVDVASKVLKGHLTNEIGAVVPYRGRPPIFMTPTAMGPEIYQELERLIRAAYEFAGISQLQAQAKKPVGLESAVALREYTDIGTGRFSVNEQRFEKLHLEVAQRIVMLGKELGKGSTTSVYQAKRFIQKIDWSEVDLPDDAFVVSIEASSILSKTPAGRLQSVIEMAQGGLIDTDEARRLLNHPDLERSQSLANAAIEDIEATIEDLLNGDFKPPEPFQNLGLGIERVQVAYLKARRDGAPEDILEGMRQWMARAKYLLDEAQQALPPNAQPQQPNPALSPQAQQLQPS